MILASQFDKIQYICKMISPPLSHLPLQQDLQYLTRVHSNLFIAAPRQCASSRAGQCLGAMFQCHAQNFDK